MKQQPGWKQVYDNLPANDKVVFAEVNCRESRELMQKHQVRLAHVSSCRYALHLHILWRHPRRICLILILRCAKIGKAGQGGWPTLKYFNKETGLAGAKYVQQTDKRVCDEMKDAAMVTAQVKAPCSSCCIIHLLMRCDFSYSSVARYARLRSGSRMSAASKRLLHRPSCSSKWHDW